MSVYREGFMMLEAIQNSSSERGLLIRKGDDNWNLAGQVAYTYGERRTQQGIPGSRIVTTYMELINEWGYSDDESNLPQEAKQAKYTQRYRLQYIERSLHEGYLIFSRLS